MAFVLLQTAASDSHSKTLTAVPLIFSIETLFPLFTLQQYIVEHNVAQTISAYSTWICLACFAYIIVLSVFRLIFFENDSMLHSVLHTIFGFLLLIAQSYSNRLPPIAVITVQLVISAVAFCFVWCLHRHYVSGCKYESTNLEKKVFIITGSNTGIGYETAKNIVSMGGTVVLACRFIDKAQIAREEIVRTTNCRKENVIVLKLDLSLLSSVRQFADDFRALKLPLHALINNAGVMMSSRQLTPDGFEKDFMVNYLGHFLLTNLLLPELELTNGRVVNVSSSMHKLKTRFEFDNVMAEKSFSLFGTYAQSKLAMILFTGELQRRLEYIICDIVLLYLVYCVTGDLFNVENLMTKLFEYVIENDKIDKEYCYCRLCAKGSRITCNTMHPGCVHTEITRDLHIVVRVANALCPPCFVPLRKTAAEGAYTSTHLATAAGLEGKGGQYYFHCKPVPPGPCVVDDVASEKLWKMSETLARIVMPN